MRFQIRPSVDCNDGFVASRRPLATSAFGPVGCEDNTVTYRTQRALALVSATSVAGYHLLGAMCLALACPLRGTTHLLSMPLMVTSCIVILERH